MVFSIFLDGLQIFRSGEINIGVSSAKLNMEINEIGTFNFSIKNYAIPSLKNDILAYKSTVGVTVNDDYTWAGRVTNVTKDIYGNLTVDCEEAIAVLNDIYVPYRSRYYETIDDALTGIVTNYDNVLEGYTDKKIFVTYMVESENEADKTPFEVLKNKIEELKQKHQQEQESQEQESQEQTEEKEETMSFLKGFDMFKDKVLKRMSAMIYPTYSYGAEDGSINCTIRFIKQLSQGLGYGYDEEPDYEGCPVFVTGQNILDIEEEPSKWNPYSGILPIGKDGLTIGGLDYTSYDDVIWSEALEAKFGRIVKTLDFSEIEYAEDLLNLSVLYFQYYGFNPGTKFTITAIEPIEVFSNVKYIARVGHTGIVNNYQSPFLSVHYDLMDLQNAEYILGPLVPEGIINEDITHLT